MNFMKRNLSILISATVALFMLSCGRSYEETHPIRKDITEMVFASGVLEAKGSYELKAQVDGYIREIYFNENDLVKDGQLLAVIDNEQNRLNAQSAEVLYEIAKANTAPQLIQAKNSVELAKAQMKQDSLTVVRYKSLSDANAIAKVEYEDALLKYENAKIAYENATKEYQIQKNQAEQQLVINKTQKNINQTLSAYNELIAVKAGKVYSKLKQEGDFVQRGEAIALIGDPEEMYAKVNIDEQSIGKIEVGQKTLIQLNIDKEKHYVGSVTEILPTFDESTQSFTAKIGFKEPLNFKIANTQLQANIVVDSVKNALLIPRKFLGYGNEVFIKGENQPTQVKTGIVSTDWVQVLGGIDENTLIVAQN